MNPPALGPHFSNFGVVGPLRPDDAPSTIGVLLDLDAPPMPVGIAFGCGYVEERKGKLVATWRLVVSRAEIPGRFVCIGRRFLEVDEWREREAIQGE